MMLKDYPKSVLKRSSWKFVDRVNCHFVSMAQSMMRFITFKNSSQFADSSYPRSRDPSDPDDQPTDETPHSSSLSFLSKELRSKLQKKVDQGLTRISDRLAAESAQPVLSEFDIDESEEINIKLRELFHIKTDRRLCAANWFKNHPCHTALPALEGVLCIEEDERVKQELVRALHVLRLK